MFLYKSIQANALLKSRFVDYAVLGSFFGFVGGVHNLLFIPMVYGLLHYPKKLGIMNYFTFHAELLPHTE